MKSLGDMIFNVLLERIGFRRVLELQVEYDHQYHQHKIEQVDGKQIFPLELQELVNTQTGECPLKPNNDKADEE
jgi:hypothetical protein